MHSITNRKVAGLEPKWAPFRGFSMLFDNPGDGLTSHGSYLELTCCLDSDPELGFFRGLNNSLNELDLAHLASEYSFCPLPTASYHVTAWDGGNDANVAQVTGKGSTILQEFLASLPDGICDEHEFTEIPLTSAVNLRRDWNLDLKFKNLLNFNGSCLLAILEPTDLSQKRFDGFVSARAELCSEYREDFGIGASEKFTPHVTLGYFANLEAGSAAAPLLPDWNDRFSAGLQGKTLTFQRASLYGFTDMATFFKSSCK